MAGRQGVHEPATRIADGIRRFAANAALVTDFTACRWFALNFSELRRFALAGAAMALKMA